MKKGRILIVEDDFDIANLLKMYFGGQGYTVITAHRGRDALEQARRHAPGLIILDIELPDMNGYEICRALRSAALTRYVPIIFLTSRRDRHHMIEGLELGADDYVTKPFDIEELKLRIENSLALAEGMRGIHEISGFPTAPVLEQHLQKLFKAKADWTYLDIRMHHFEAFSEIYGWSAANEVIRALALLIRDVVESVEFDETQHSFMGHPSRDTFAVVTSLPQSDIDAIKVQLKARFADETQPHYSYIDRDNGYMTLSQGTQAQQLDLMHLDITALSTQRDVPETVAEVNRILTQKRRHHNPVDDKKNIPS